MKKATEVLVILLVLALSLPALAYEYEQILDFANREDTWTAPTVVLNPPERDGLYSLDGTNVTGMFDSWLDITATDIDDDRYAEIDESQDWSKEVWQDVDHSDATIFCRYNPIIGTTGFVSVYYNWPYE